MKKINRKTIYIVLISILFLLMITVTLFLLQKKHHIFSSQITKDIINIKEDKTIEGKKIIIKDKTEFNKIIEFEFEENIVKAIKIYEQFENKEEYENAKESYMYLDSVNVLKQDDNNMYIYLEKNDLESDTNLSYEEIYDKYLVQIIEAYEIIE